MAAALLRGGHTHLWQSRVRDLSVSGIPYGFLSQPAWRKTRHRIDTHKAKQRQTAIVL